MRKLPDQELNKHRRHNWLMQQAIVAEYLWFYGNWSTTDNTGLPLTTVSSVLDESRTTLTVQS